MALESPSWPSSPQHKRIKLKSPEPDLSAGDEIPEDLEENHCCICLQAVVDRTVIPTCSHEFCFECLMIWTEQSRRCPLCSQNIGEYVIHNIRSRYDYQKHFLPPMRSKSPSMLPRRSIPGRNTRRRPRIPREIRERSRRERDERIEADRFERAVARRRWIYEYHLYTKHVASNSHTRYRPYPAPAQFSASQELISRVTSFLRRELLVWPDLDVEFLTTFIISLMKAIDIRSESAVKLLAEFLDMDTPYVQGRRHVNAEHFAHEVYSYVRSPYKDLFVYDSVVQYDDPPPESPPRRQRQQHSSRWREPSHSPSPLSPSPPPPESRLRSSLYPSPPPPHRSLGQAARRSGARSISRSRSHSRSWSPSGRTYPSFRERGLYPERSFSPKSDRDREGRRRKRGHPHDNVQSNSVHRLHRDSGLSSRDDNGPSSSRELTITGKGKERAGSDDDEAFEESVTLGTRGSSLALEEITESRGGKLNSEMNGKVPCHVSQRNFPTMSGNVVTRASDPSRSLKTNAAVSVTRSRNRTLLDSVQAHLNINPAKGLVSKPLASDSGSRPSLLLRLSDVHVDDSPSPKATAHHITPISINLSTHPQRAEKVDQLAWESSPLPSTAPTALSPSRIASPSSNPGLNVHDRLAQLKDQLRMNRSSAPMTSKSMTADMDHEVHPTENSHDAFSNNSNCDPDNGDRIMKSSDIDVDVDNDIDMSDFPTLTTHPSRTILLRKLEEEKRKIQIRDASHTDVGASSGFGGLLSSSGTRVSSSLDSNAMELEAKLRMRARLKARLASEKRSGAGCG